MKTGRILTITLIALSVSFCGKKSNEIKPERRDVTETVFASGTLEPDDKYNLTALTDGYILELKFDNGDTVKANQVLAVIDNKASSVNAESAASILNLVSINASVDGPTLKQAQQNTELLRQKSEQDSVQYSRYQKLYASNSVSKLELENIKLASQSSKTNYLNALQNYRLLKQQTEQQLLSQKSQKEVSSITSENNSVKAVVGGKVYRRMKEVGDYVRRGDVIAVIGNASTLYAKLSVDESNISKIRVGEEVVVQLNTNKEKNYKGVVSEIYPFFDEPTQSFYCKVKFEEEPGLKISGIQLQANIIVASKKQALVIPRLYLGYGNKVTDKEKGEVLVKTGFVSNEWVEILEGVNESSTLISDQVK